ncbi:flippase [uncultured Treponema sp.]|uniref:flippase n=1 Tax=uncultured Treponema sp. TaxID=162155 RepID=UPI0025FF5C56|nr:flippase [uncultured Treponema sp.]
MVQKSLKKNAVYSFIKALMNLAFPLISFPYASRILLPAGIGKVNFANSVIEYFTLAASLGIFSYAAREAVRVRDDRHALNKIFREILTINLISTAFSYILLFISLVFVSKFSEYRVLLIVCSTKILFTTIGVDWIFNVQEEYKYVTIRSVIFQIISLVLLFVFVRTPDDYVAYAFMGVFSSVGSNICNIFYARKFVNFFEKTAIEIKRHLKPIFTFFGMSVASKIHTALDSVMLGFMLSDSAVGYYSAANKIKGLVVGLITAILATLLPRSSYYLGQNKNDEYQKIVSKALNFSLFFSLPSAIGIMLLAKPLILLFSGEEFLAALPAMLIMSPVIVFIAVASFADNMILLPQRLEKVSLQSQIIGCIVNIVLNYTLIPIWGVFGAAFSTFIVEGIITIYKILFSIKYIKCNGLIQNLLKIIFSCTLMSLAVLAILYFIKNVFIQIAAGVTLGAMIYAVCTLLLRTDTALMLTETIKKRIKR